MATGERTSGAGWRLGLPAALMLAFAAIGLSTWWQDDRPAPAPGAARPGALVSSTIAAASVAAPAAPAPAEPAAPGRSPVEVALPPEPAAEEPSDPVLRLPEEIAPLGPDVVVALEPWRPEPDALAATVHTHLADDAAVGAPLLTTEGLGPQAGDDFQGPEPGALYWFGPVGLERIRLLEEARRR